MEGKALTGDSATCRRKMIKRRDTLRLGLAAFIVSVGMMFLKLSITNCSSGESSNSSDKNTDNGRAPLLRSLKPTLLLHGEIDQSKSPFSSLSRFPPTSRPSLCTPLRHDSTVLAAHSPHYCIGGTNLSYPPVWDVEAVSYAALLQINRGQRVAFVYTPYHNLSLTPTLADWVSCSKSAMTVVGSPTEGNVDKGGKVIQFNKPGLYFFTSSIGEHCKEGLKVILKVNDYE